MIRGPNKHPGANAIEDEFGNKVLLKADDELSRLAIAKTLQLSSNNGILSTSFAHMHRKHERTHVRALNDHVRQKHVTMTGSTYVAAIRT